MLFSERAVLIASVFCCEAVQRQRLTRHGETHVVATLGDAHLANQLAGTTFGRRVDELLPQAQQLLEQLVPKKTCGE